MKIFIYCRQRDEVDQSNLRHFSGLAREAGFEVETEKSPTQSDVKGGAVMMAIGGDGTFLDAVRSLKGLPMPIIGVNAGRLGFLSSIAPDNFTAALDDLKNGNFTIEKRTMLTVKGDFGRNKDGSTAVPEFPCALNEFTLHRHTADMVEVSMWADGQLLAVIRGDGVIVSTPTGSTAYSLSAGGPIVAPQCGCFVISAIAPHNFSVRPLVVPDSAKIELQVRTRGHEVLASIDNAPAIVGDGARFTIRKANFHAFFAHTQNISFYDTLRDRIMWGLDRRDGAKIK